MLANKTIVLGITGSIAAYKGADLASKLTQAGALVDVILTPAATEFVSPLTFQSVTGRPAFTDIDQPGKSRLMTEDVGDENLNLVIQLDQISNRRVFDGEGDRAVAEQYGLLLASECKELPDDQCVVAGEEFHNGSCNADCAAGSCVDVAS